MADHSWLVFAIHDIRDYVEMNGLDHLMPVIETAYAAVERSVTAQDSTGSLSAASHLEADAVLASLLEEAAREEQETVPDRTSVKRMLS